MNHPIVTAIAGLVDLLVSAATPPDVRGVQGEDSLTVEIRPADDYTAGLIIGKQGVTVEALRHLAQRAGRAQAEQIHVSVVVVNPVGSRKR